MAGLSSPHGSTSQNDASRSDATFALPAPTHARVVQLTLATFVVALLAGAAIVAVIEQNRFQQRQKHAGEIAVRSAYTLHDHLSRSLSATYALAALVRQGNGTIENFEELGTEMLGQYGGINSLQLAPGGVLRQIVPLAGNEKAIGLDLLNSPKVKKEALMAVTSRSLSLAGPFELIQGGQAVVGRLPVFLGDSKGKDRFWGLTAVVIRIPDFIKASHLQQSIDVGYDFELSRVNPTTAAREIFARSSLRELNRPVQHAIQVPNGVWTLSMAPRNGWFSPAAIAGESALVLLVSTLLALMMRMLYRQPLVLQGMVEQRTRELSESNLRLTAEVSERERVQQALSGSEERYRTLVDNIPLGISLIDRDYRIVMVNHTLAEWLGHRPEWFSGRHCYEEFEKREKICEHCPGMVSMATGGVSAIDTEGFRGDGSRMVVRLRTVPLISADGDQKGFIEVVEDITEHKRAEEERSRLEMQILHAQKLESLGVLAGGIAHDFNNILLAIMGHAELALMRSSPAAPAREHMERILQAGERASDLARQMLAYSGKGKFVITRIHLGELVKEMTHMLEVSISKKAVLRLNLTADLPPVEVDATQIRQVLMNLVINASEAIGDKSGVIAITSGAMQCDRRYLSEVWLDERLPEGLYVYLEVADTGCGMDRETQAKIFDPFFTTKFTGRGLGMAAVLGIMRGHHGAIKVYSEPGRGSTFKILLPAAGGSAEALYCISAEEELWQGSGTVLLVDDEDTVRALGGEMLAALGYKALVAADGREALEVFRECQERIDAVILDLTMPHMDGEETFRELRRNTPDIKVIMSSGYNEQEVSERFIGKGMTGFIQKPYKMSELSSVLRSALAPADPL